MSPSSPAVILSEAKNPFVVRGILRCAQDDNSFWRFRLTYRRTAPTALPFGLSGVFPARVRSLLLQPAILLLNLH